MRSAAVPVFLLLVATAALAAPPDPELVEKVRERCQLAPAADVASYPWYFHYELAMELEARGDWESVIQSVEDALARRAEPSEHGRTYGMWFLDYRPNFHLGLAYHELGRHACAADAFRRSESAGELATNPELAALRRDLLARSLQGDESSPRDQPEATPER